ncbi:hypothetical protein PAECIP111893_03220 [Paenibacillus plantiphilus]|uniref:Uncharacterized protein n=1 Tax=Paenibacillus plantiphilus TaxID=2905650 RepID=A0ABM9CET2_9BACL|nr:hypothetical protein PAECIP111893_03220 [Paenibacillus plantiphilus]
MMYKAADSVCIGLIERFALVRLRFNNQLVKGLAEQQHFAVHKRLLPHCRCHQLTTQPFKSTIR